MITSKTSELASHFNEGNQINLSFHYHNKKIITFLNSLFTKILSRDNIIYLQSTIMTIMRELIVNAVKANSKRIYFDLNNLNIQDQEEYIEGMKNFKNYIVHNQQACEDELKQSQLEIKITIKRMDDGIKIDISNNVPMVNDELDKINHRIEKAKEYNDFSEVYADLSDDTEGEGLGILLTMFFLRNSGIGENSFSIKSEGNKTVTSLLIPYELQPKKIKTRIQEQILYEIDELPTLPNYIHELLDMIKDPKITLKNITEKISHDPSMSTAVLKLANSAGFITRNKAENIHDAIKIIGLKNLNAIIMATGARKIMDEKFSKFNDIWKHCNKVAVYSRLIAQKFKYGKISDRVFLSGLLHDLGKIVLLSVNSALSEWISEVTQKRQVRTSTIIEEVSIGMSHSSIGEIVARKWNMPDYIIQSIRHHHSPLDAGKEFQAIINIVYFANQIVGVEEKKYSYEYIENEIFNNLIADAKINIIGLHKEIMKKYEEQSVE